MENSSKGVFECQIWIEFDLLDHVSKHKKTGDVILFLKPVRALIKIKKGYFGENVTIHGFCSKIEVADNE